MGMSKNVFCAMAVALATSMAGWAQTPGADSAAGGQPQGEKKFEVDTISTKTGDLKITFIGHATLMLQYGGKVIHVDPRSKLADYTKLPKGDLVLITHDHSDHLDPRAVRAIRGDNTAVVAPWSCQSRLDGVIFMANGGVQTVQGFKIEAIPAYNMPDPERPGKRTYHPKGDYREEGNGYVINMGETRVYVAGDTENTPEMKKLEKIDIAFLPMNQPYTMTPAMAADAAKAIKPKILYPYHYGETDPNELVTLLKDSPEIEVRIRKMQ
jgi:L-ascorbate metabolism protein UlaG (beta-lactamase superfamily)